MQAYPYHPNDEPLWDELAARSVNGTFLHTRRFLSYHKNRFRDASLMIRDEHDRLVGLLPAAIAPNDDRVVISHPGITYGGLVRTADLYGPWLMASMEACVQYYRQSGFERLQYKPIPYIYHHSPADDDLYTLFRLGATVWRTDLCAAVNLRARGTLSRNRKTGIKRSQAAGIEICTEAVHLSELWAILETQLADRHEARPVHTLQEIHTIYELFPLNVSCVTALSDGRVVAGIVLFDTPRVTRAQYSAADDYAREVSALDLVFDTAIATSAQQGKWYFDFGNSNEANGMILNEGLYRYKIGLGAGGLVQSFYDLTLHRT